MSNRRESTTLTKDEVNDLIFKLQALLPDPRSRPNNKRRVSSSSSSSAAAAAAEASKVLVETCNHIKNLQREVDGLSRRLSQILASGDITAVDADIIRALLRQQ